MPIDLNKPVSWKDASKKALLENLQGNILKGHGRDNATLLFIRFKTGAAAAARAFLQETATTHVGNALEELREAEDFKKSGTPGATHVSIALSASCYAFLGLLDARTPSDAAFRASLRQRKDILKDPPVSRWEKGLRQEIHALVLIADDLKACVDDVRSRIEESLAAQAAGKVVAREDGQVMRNKTHDGIEHFGYVDGRSQPLMLVEDINNEKGGIDKWDPTFGIGTALVPDPADPSGNGFGSYLVFRKLEQNVRGFKASEQKLAAKLGLVGEDAELAGALVIGRFEDGTPVVLQKTDGMGGTPPNRDVPNNFGFNGDKQGMKCPFAGHIRKTNPRGDTVALGAALQDERGHLMPRRGIPFGTRATHPNDPVLEDNPKLNPTKGVGLLFMAFNADISRQFEFTQQSWVNSSAFAGNTGIDGVIANGKNPPGMQKWPKVWGQSASGPMVSFDFSGFVTMKGGEYFFAPSLTFLRTLGRARAARKKKR